MIHKRLLVPDRVRRPPREGFSWIDRRFLREYGARLSGDAVSDKDGLSFYSDAALAARLRMREQGVSSARDELLTHDLIAFQPPLTQVLSWPRSGQVQRGGLHALGEVLRALGNPPGRNA
jgi:hypothetical protein